jgi:hypothetical protein
MESLLKESRGLEIDLTERGAKIFFRRWLSLSGLKPTLIWCDCGATGSGCYEVSVVPPGLGLFSSLFPALEALG